MIISKLHDSESVKERVDIRQDGNGFWGQRIVT